MKISEACQYAENRGVGNGAVSDIGLILIYILEIFVDKDILI